MHRPSPAIPERHRARLIPWLGLLTTALAAPVRAEPAPAPAPERWFMHASDPQIGFGLDGRGADVERFARLLAHAAEQQAAFVVITGDLVQDRSFLQWRGFEGALRGARVPVYLVPGNHDVLDRDSLADYRERIGPDYYVQQAGDVTLIVVDSETVRDPVIDARENNEQWAWLERALAEQGCAKGALCLLATHRPPFVAHPDEPETHENWPPGTRRRLLELLQEHGVRTVLAGHLHRTLEATDPERGIRIWVVGGTARVYDELGAGYRELKARGGALEQRYVMLEPLELPRDFLGIAGWTPRLFQPSVRHWLLTLGECAAGVLAWLAALRWRRAGWRLPGSTGGLLWHAIGATLMFFGVNEQLDLDELLLALLRGLAHGTGWHEARHLVGGIVAGGFVLAVLALAAWLLVRAKQARKWAIPVLITSSVPFAWFVLSTLSDHGFGMVFSNDAWDLLLFAAIALTLAGCVQGLRHATRAVRWAERRAAAER